MTKEELKQILDVCSSCPEVREDIFKNHDNNMWWPLEVEDYRKMFLAMGKDIRVILIKLADRLHNMRTLKYLKRERQIANAKETMELYAPLANRLGLYSVKWELEDLGFKYLNPEEYHELVEGINKKREERLEFIEKIMGDIRVQLKKQRIDAEVTRKSKTFI